MLRATHRIPPILQIVLFVLVCTALQADVINVPDGGDLQAAINNANPGDTIVLNAGSTYVGNFVLPDKGSDPTVITITSSNLSSLPPPDHRVSPADAPNMPKLMTPSTDSALNIADRAHNYRIVGLEFEVSPANYVYQVISVGSPFNTDPTAFAHDIELDRIYVHGDPVNGTKFGVYLNGKATTVKNSYIAQIASTFQDAIGIVGIFGPGPFWILNNYVESAGENIFFAAASNFPNTGIESNIPADVVIRGNYVRKPLSWRKEDPSYAGVPWTVKNLLELKAGQRFLIEGNIFENSWVDAQVGFGIVLTLRSGGDPNTKISDITFRNNILRHVAGGFNIQGVDDDGSGSTTNEYIHDNILVDVTQSLGGNGHMFQSVGGTNGLVIDHNTCFQEWNLLDGWSFPTNGFVFTNNIAPLAGYGVVATSTGPGTASLNAYFPGWVFQGNVLIGSPVNYPTQNAYVSSADSVGFVDRAGGDYHLKSTSPYKNAGTDGKDVGADIDAVLAATAGAISGVAVPVGSVSITPQTISLKGASQQQFTAAIGGNSTSAVSWSISPALGSISSSGVYTAPVLVTALHDIVITATSTTDPTQNGKAYVTLQPSNQVGITISPTTTQLFPGQSQQFSATATGGNSSGVTWSILPAIGSISSTGVYTAPATVTTQQDVRIIATSVADTTHEASGYVTLLPATPVAVSVSPAAVYLFPGLQQQFTATVRASNNSAVNWTITPSLGTISPSGLYTAPMTVAAQQDIRITATSVADPVHESTGYVTLLPVFPVAVSVSPAAILLSAGQQQQFTATVTNGTSNAVNWTITPSLGSISSTGLYTAPASVTAQQDVRITATSASDPTHESVAYVTLLPAAPGVAPAQGRSQRR